MKKSIKIFAIAIIGALVIMFFSNVVKAQDDMSSDKMKMKDDKMSMGTKKMAMVIPGALKPSGRYNNDKQVFIKSVLDIDVSDKTAKSATFPLLQGWTAKGEKTYYIITESSNYDDAKKLGVNYSPIMKFAIGTQAAQNVARGNGGKIKFKGTVDFSPVRVLIQGSPKPFPPSTFKPGAIGDADYSPLIVMPDGIVYNAPQLANNTGVQDRVISIDYDKMTIKILISDGWYKGDKFFYHLVTDASDALPAAIENAIFAERLKYLPTGGAL